MWLVSHHCCSAHILWSGWREWECLLYPLLLCIRPSPLFICACSSLWEAAPGSAVWLLNRRWCQTWHGSVLLKMSLCTNLCKVWSTYERQMHRKISRNVFHRWVKQRTSVIRASVPTEVRHVECTHGVLRHHMSGVAYFCCTSKVTEKMSYVQETMSFIITIFHVLDFTFSLYEAILSSFFVVFPSKMHLYSKIMYLNGTFYESSQSYNLYTSANR